MTARDDYPSHEQTFAAADGKIELAQQLLSRAEPVVEGDAAWLYLTRTRHLPADKVRPALPELRLITPLIEGRAASDYGVASLLRDRDGEISGLQLAFVDATGAASAKSPKRQTYALRERGVRDGTFRAGGGPGDVAYICEGYLEKPLAVAALGIGPVYGAGGRAILGCAPPPEPVVVLVADRRPDDTVVDLKTGLTAADLHDRDYKRAADLLLLAGKAVSVTPDPPVCPHQCKDADDVLVKHGPILLEEWIRRAQPVDSLSLDGEARRIARIADPLERDRETTAAAKRLKVRVGVLREAVRRYHDGGADRPTEDLAPGSAMVFEDLAPAAERQDGARLLDDVADAIRRHAFLDQGDRVKCVLWTVHGHRRFLGNTTVLPRLVITAASPDSGKTTLGVTIRCLSDIAEHMVSPTPANIFRAIEALNCACLLDEADVWYPRNEALREIVNAGFTVEGATVLRVEDVGRGAKRVLEPRRFSVFAPIAVIGNNLERVLAWTILSRALIVRMRPARVREVAEDIFGNREAVARLRILAGRIKRWVADSELALSVATPAMPEGVINRLRLTWRPMLAIADRAGGNWPRLAREALAADLARERDPGLGEQLLLDIRDAIVAHGRMVGDRLAMHTGAIIEQLLQLELRTWSVFGKARQNIRDTDVARLLSPYEVRPEQIKIGKLNRRGYQLPAIEAAIARYVPPKHWTSDPIDPDRRYPATEGSKPSDPAGFDGSGGDSTSPLHPSSPLPGGGISNEIPGEVAATSEVGASAFLDEDQSGSGVAAQGPITTQEHIAGNGSDPEPRAELSTITCASCGSEFPRPPRGRPPKRCPACRGLKPEALDPGVVWS